MAAHSENFVILACAFLMEDGQTPSGVAIGCAGCAVNMGLWHSGAPNRLGSIFRASKNLEIMKYTRQMYNEHKYIIYIILLLGLSNILFALGILHKHVHFCLC